MLLYSGDIFRTDAEGWLYFVARKDDIIKSRGEKVSPREVENAIYSLEGGSRPPWWACPTGAGRGRQGLRRAETGPVTSAT
jgi:acyl-CoA synthetase (AMP-forming)/AMP-acid ligase II